MTSLLGDDQVNELEGLRVKRSTDRIIQDFVTQNAPRPEPEPNPIEQFKSFADNLVKPFREKAPEALAQFSSFADELTAPFRQRPSAVSTPGIDMPTAAPGSKESVIHGAANEYGIRPDIFDRQLTQEGAKADDVWSGQRFSSAGARGPGQFMPATAAGVAKQMGVSIDQFWADPALQVRGAALHMRDLLNQYDGDYSKALSAYNAGPGAVAQYGGVPPFQETQHYIKTILGDERPVLRPGSAPASESRSTATPGQLTTGEGTRAMREGEPLRNSQFGDPALTSAEANAACGPAAALAFAKKMGRNPTLREATDLAATVGWTTVNGMAGPSSQVALLKKMGIAASMSAPDERRMAADVQAGNPVTVDTPGHYFVAEDYDPKTGRFNWGTSAGDLKITKEQYGGNTWWSLAELGKLNMGAARTAIHMDNPETPQPSVVAGRNKGTFTIENAPELSLAVDQVAQKDVQNNTFKGGLTYEQAQNTEREFANGRTLAYDSRVSESGEDASATVAGPPVRDDWARDGNSPPRTAFPSAQPDEVEPAVTPTTAEAPSSGNPPPSGNPIVDGFNALADGMRNLGNLIGGGQKPDYSQAARDIQQRQATVPGSPQAEALAEEPLPLDQFQNRVDEVRRNNDPLPALPTAETPIDLGEVVRERAQDPQSLTQRVLGPLASTFENAQQTAQDIATPDRSLTQRVTQPVARVLAPGLTPEGNEEFYGGFQRGNELFRKQVDGTITPDEEEELFQLNRKQSQVVSRINKPDMGFGDMPNPNLPKGVNAAADFAADGASRPGLPYSAKRRYDVDTLYHETSPTEAGHYVNGDTGMLEGRWVSPDPDLALGQGSGRGAVIELGNTPNIEVRPERGKAGARFIEETQGAAPPEMTILGRPNGNTDNYVKSITFKGPDVKIDRVTRLRLRNSGWQHEKLDDGSVRFTNPKFPEDVVPGQGAINDIPVDQTPPLALGSGGTPPMPPVKPPPPSSGGGSGGKPPLPPGGTPPSWGQQPNALPPGGQPTPPGPTVNPASADWDKIAMETAAVARGAPKPPTYAPEVEDAFSWRRHTKNLTSISDRREGLQAVEAHVEKVTGQPMLWDDSVWARSRVYEGAGDAALSWLEDTVGTPLKAYAKSGGKLDDMNILIEQIDNHFKNIAAQKKVPAGQSPVDRLFSGGARAQELNDIYGNLVTRFGPDKADMMIDTAEQVAKATDAMRERLMQAGVISEDTRNLWQTEFPMYVRAEILQGMSDEALRGIPTGATLFGSQSTTYKPLGVKGTERYRQSAIPSVTDMAVMTQKRAEQNIIAQRVAAWADIPGLQNFVRKVGKDAEIPEGWTRMPYLVNGKRHDMAVVNPMVTSLEVNNMAHHGLVAGILSAASEPLRAGATRLRPAFIAANAFADTLGTLARFGIESPNPAEFVRSVPDILKGFRVALGTQAGGRATGAAIGAVAGNQSTPEGASWEERAARIGAGAGIGAGAARSLGKIDSAGDAAILKRMRDSGASIYTGTKWDGRPDLIAKELAGQHVWVRTIRDQAGLKTALKDFAGATLDSLTLPLKPLEYVGAPLENANRIAAFSRAERQQGRMAASSAMTPGTASTPGTSIANIPGTGIAEMPGPGTGITRPQLASGQGAAGTAASVAPMPQVTPSSVGPALASRRVTADFGAGGNLMKAITTAVPFLNATTQASLEFADVARKNPAKAMAAFATVASAVVANEVWNRHVSPEDYQDVQRYTKNTGIVILSDEEPPEGGKRGVLYLPMRGAMGSIIPVIRDAFARWHQEDPAPIEQLFAHMFGTITPFPGSAEGASGAVMPPYLRMLIEGTTNKNLHTGLDIVSKSMEGLPASEQYGPRTSNSARFLSESGLPMVANKPPIAIEHELKQWSPGPAEMLLGIGDMLLEHYGGSPPRRDAAERVKGPSDTPVTGGIVGRFVRTVGDERRNVAFEKADVIIEKQQQLMLDMVRSSAAYQRATPDDQARMLRSAQDSLIESAREQTGATAGEKDYGAPKRYQGVTAGSDREKKILDAINTPTAKRTPAQANLANQYQGAENPAYKAWATKRDADTSKLRTSVKTLAQE